MKARRWQLKAAAFFALSIRLYWKDSIKSEALLT